MNLIINEEFARLIPPLSVDELDRLEQSLLNEGCLNPIIVWNNTIIDGHHRYAICSKHGISFNIIEKAELETELDVKLWMINNQFSRRNLAIETRLALAYRFKEFEAERAKERQLSALKQFSKQKESAELSKSTDSKPVYTRPQDISDPKEETGRALEAIAKKAGVSHTTAFQYDKIQQQGTEEQKAEVAEGKSSIKKVYTEIQKGKQPDKEQKIVHLKLKGSGVVVIQKYITRIYNELEDFNTSQDLTGIRYLLLNSGLGENDNFVACISNIDKQKKLVTRNLTQLSESVEDLELFVNKGKNLALIEAKKDKKILKIYERYYG